MIRHDYPKNHVNGALKGIFAAGLLSGALFLGLIAGLVYTGWLRVVAPW